MRALLKGTTTFWGAKTSSHGIGQDLVDLEVDIENGKIFGNSMTKAYFITSNKQHDLGKITKTQLALLLAKEIVNYFK